MTPNRCGAMFAGMRIAVVVVAVTLADVVENRTEHVTSELSSTMLVRELNVALVVDAVVTVMDWKASAGMAGASNSGCVPAVP